MLKTNVIVYRSIEEGWMVKTMSRTGYQVSRHFVYTWLAHRLTEKAMIWASLQKESMEWYAFFLRLELSTQQTFCNIYYVQKYDQDMNMGNRHWESRNIRNTQRFSFGSGTKLFITFLSLRLFDMRRERHNFFLCWLFHLTPPRAAPRRKLLVWPRWAPKINFLPLASNLN